MQEAVESYPFGGIGAMNGGYFKAINVGGLAVNFSELLKREVDIRGVESVTSVPEHLQDCSARKKVSVALSGAIVDVATQASAKLHLIRLSLKPIFLHLRSLPPRIERSASFFLL